MLTIAGNSIQSLNNKSQQYGPTTVLKKIDNFSFEFSSDQDMLDI